MEPLGNNKGNLLPLCALPVTIATAPCPHVIPWLFFSSKLAQVLQVHGTVLDMEYRFHESHIIGAINWKDFSA